MEDAHSHEKQKEALKIMSDMEFYDFVKKTTLKTAINTTKQIQDASLRRIMSDMDFYDIENEYDAVKMQKASKKLQSISHVSVFIIDRLPDFAAQRLMSEYISREVSLLTASLIKELKGSQPPASNEEINKLLVKRCPQHKRLKYSGLFNSYINPIFTISSCDRMGMKNLAMSPDDLLDDIEDDTILSYDERVNKVLADADKVYGGCGYIPENNEENNRFLTTLFVRIPSSDDHFMSSKGKKYLVFAVNCEEKDIKHLGCEYLFIKKYQRSEIHPRNSSHLSLIARFITSCITSSRGLIVKNRKILSENMRMVYTNSDYTSGLFFNIVNMFLERVLSATEKKIERISKDLVYQCLSDELISAADDVKDIEKVLPKAVVHKLASKKYEYDTLYHILYNDNTPFSNEYYVTKAIEPARLYNAFYYDDIEADASFITVTEVLDTECVNKSIITNIANVNIVVDKDGRTDRKGKVRKHAEINALYLSPYSKNIEDGDMSTELFLLIGMIKRVLTLLNNKFVIMIIPDVTDKFVKKTLDPAHLADLNIILAHMRKLHKIQDKNFYFPAVSISHSKDRNQKPVEFENGVQMPFIKIMLSSKG